MRRREIAPRARYARPCSDTPAAPRPPPCPLTRRLPMYSMIAAAVRCVAAVRAAAALRAALLVV
eukprot:4446347-Prymnesium_polylepis.1